MAAIIMKVDTVERRHLKQAPFDEWYELGYESYAPSSDAVAVLGIFLQLPSESARGRLLLAKAYRELGYVEKAHPKLLARIDNGVVHTLRMLRGIRRHDSARPAL